MSSLSLDTHGFIKQLTKVGMPEKQAEAIVDGFQKAQIQNVAAAGDIASVKDDIADVRTAIAELEARLTNRMIGFLSVAVALLGAFMTALKLYS